MKKISSLIISLSFVSMTQAQVPANTQKMMQEAQAQLKALQNNPAFKKAQHIMDSIKSDPKVQKQMQQATAQLDSMKKTNPALANVQMPSLNNLQTPNLDSLGTMMNSASQKLQQYTQAIDQTTPKQNLFHHAEKIAKFSQNDIIALANSIIKNTKPTFDVAKLSNLNALLKDTSINVASLGVHMLALGFSNNAAVYLICHSILKNPKDPWAVNDLGVFFRGQMDYEKALQCFFYANRLDGKEATVNTNIGWASAYYGDFDAAKKYFDKALAINDDFTSALEGKATVAFAEGDIATLLKCLLKEVKYFGGATDAGSGPSPAFASLCGGVAAENEGNLDNQTTDPTSDHTFDNPNPDGANSSDTPPGGQVDDIKYERYLKAFNISDAKQIMEALTEGSKQEIQSVTELKNREVALTSQLKSLKPLVQQAYSDGEGRLIYPASFRSYVEMLTPIEISFEKRMAWWITKLRKESEPFRKQVAQRDANMIELYVQALFACGDNDENCRATVNCTWLPKMHSSKNADLVFIIKIWNEYYDNATKAIQWYIDASAPFIHKVQDDEWNKYLNANREFEVRKAILQSYGSWVELVGDIATSVVMGYLNLPVPPCPGAKMFASIQAPDPFSIKPHHIYEFKDPNCFDITTGAKGILTDEMTCHGEKVTFGIKTPKGSPIDVDLSGFAENITDPLKASDLGYDKKTGLGVGAGISIAEVVGLSGEDKEESTYLNGQLQSSTFTENAKLSVSKIPIAGIENIETIAGANISDNTTSLGPSSIIPHPKNNDLK